MADYIKAIREQKAWEEPKKKSGSASFIAGIVGAFAAGLLLVFGLGGLSSLKMKLAPTALSAATETTAAAPAKDAEPAPAAVAAAMPAPAVSDANKPNVTIPTGDRLGKPETSPLLLQCYATLTRGHDVGKMKAGDVYRLMKVGGKVSRIATLAGAPLQGVNSQLVAYGWGLMTDCIFKQNSWTMCEPRNRTLAVESITEFARQHRVAMEEELPQNSAPSSRNRSRRGSSSTDLNPHYLRQNLINVHDRTMASFRHLLEDGILIASDFGYFPPAELSPTLTSVKPKRNACASR